MQKAQEEEVSQVREVESAQAGGQQNVAHTIIFSAARVILEKEDQLVEAIRLSEDQIELLGNDGFTWNVPAKIESDNG